MKSSESKWHYCISGKKHHNFINVHLAPNWALTLTPLFPALPSKRQKTLFSITFISSTLMHHLNLQQDHHRQTSHITNLYIGKFITKASSIYSTYHIPSPYKNHPIPHLPHIKHHSNNKNFTLEPSLATCNCS